MLLEPLHVSVLFLEHKPREKLKQKFHITRYTMHIFGVRCYHSIMKITGDLGKEVVVLVIFFFFIKLTSISTYLFAPLKHFHSPKRCKGPDLFISIHIHVIKYRLRLFFFCQVDFNSSKISKIITVPEGITFKLLSFCIHLPALYMFKLSIFISTLLLHVL